MLDMGDTEFRVGGKEYVSDLVNVISKAFKSFRSLSSEAMEELMSIDEGVKEGFIAVAYVGGEAASAAQVVIRDLMLGESPLRIAGLANVGTKPGFRGRGLATSLLKEVINYLVGKGYYLMMLFAGEGSKAFRIYRKLGFEVIWRFKKLKCYGVTASVINEYLSKLSRGGIELVNEGMIQELSNSYVSNSLREGLGLTVKRSINYWRKLVRYNPYYTWFLSRSSKYWLVSDGCNSYVIGNLWSDLGLDNVKGRGGIIKEVICSDLSTCKSLIAELLSRLFRNGAKEVVIDVPPTELISTVCEGFRCSWVSSDEVLMAKVLNPNAFSKYLVDNVLSEFKCGISEDGLIELSIGGVTYYVDPLGLMKLVLNVLTPEEAIELGCLRPTNTYFKEDLKVFSRYVSKYTYPHIWVIDRW